MSFFSRWEWGKEDCGIGGGGILLIRGRVMGLLAEWWCVFAWMGVVWIWGLRDWLIGGCRCDIS